MKYLMLVCVNRPADGGAGDLGRPVGAAPDEMDVDTWVEELGGQGRTAAGRGDPSGEATRRSFACAMAGSCAPMAAVHAEPPWRRRPTGRHRRAQ